MEGGDYPQKELTVGSLGFLAPVTHRAPSVSNSAKQNLFMFSKSLALSSLAAWDRLPFIVPPWASSGLFRENCRDHLSSDSFRAANTFMPES